MLHLQQQNGYAMSSFFAFLLTAAFLAGGNYVSLLQLCIDNYETAIVEYIRLERKRNCYYVQYQKL